MKNHHQAAADHLINLFALPRIAALLLAAIPPIETRPIAFLTSKQEKKNPSNQPVSDAIPIGISDGGHPNQNMSTS